MSDTSENNSQKEYFQSIFLLVSRVLHSFDPEQLGSGKYDAGADDAYGLEVEPIAAFVIRNRSLLEQNLQPMVIEINRVWQKSFQHECPVAEAIAGQIRDELLAMN